MRGKLLFVAGIGVGFVLGARAGRGSYERIKSRAQGAWNDPRVQQGVQGAGEFVKKEAPVAAAKLKDAAVSATEAVKSRVASSSDDDTAAESSGDQTGTDQTGTDQTGTDQTGTAGAGS
jgi:hypothetical protein